MTNVTVLNVFEATVLMSCFVRVCLFFLFFFFGHVDWTLLRPIDDHFHVAPSTHHHYFIACFGD